MSRGPKAAWIWLQARLEGKPWTRIWLTALAIYLLTTLVYFGFADPRRLSEHTPYNHFSHLADAWLRGHLHLPDGPPAYAHNNDFAKFQDRWFVTFPPLPALILLPLVWLGGSAEAVYDGQVFLWLAGASPALLFVALERLAQAGYSQRRPWQNVTLSLCFALGTVYFFSAVQGTVWFAAHVVGALLAAAYLCLAIEARFPLLAGACIGLGFLTRVPLLFAVPLFALEALRTSGATCKPRSRAEGARRPSCWAFDALGEIDWRLLLRRYALFSLPIILCLAFTLWHNHARFEDALDSGYRHLTVAWQVRMKKWGLFHYHYLAKNLGVLLTSLPWTGGSTPFRINVHGLALWFTTPLYLWLLWPRRRPAMHLALWLTVAAVALPTLLYQNTGWAQFGYRFSNDYAVFLFALMALGARPLRAWFFAAALWAVVVNAFGAWTFDRSSYKKFYYVDGSQKTLYQPD